MRAAKIAAVRALHGAVSLLFLWCMAYVYRVGLTGRGDRRLVVTAIGLLTAEGVIISVNHGDCPLGTVHHAVGDDRTFFELIMPRAWAKRAVPVLGAIAAAGVVLVGARAARGQLTH